MVQFEQCLYLYQWCSSSNRVNFISNSRTAIAHRIEHFVLHTWSIKNHIRYMISNWNGWKPIHRESRCSTIARTYGCLDRVGATFSDQNVSSALTLAFGYKNNRKRPNDVYRICVSFPLFLFIILRRIDNDALTAMLTANTAYLIEVILEYVFLIRLLHPYTVRGRFMQYGGMQHVSCHIYYMKKYSYGGGDVRSY